MHKQTENKWQMHSELIYDSTMQNSDNIIPSEFKITHEIHGSKRNKTNIRDSIGQFLTPVPYEKAVPLLNKERQIIQTAGVVATRNGKNEVQ